MTSGIAIDLEPLAGDCRRLGVGNAPACGSFLRSILIILISAVQARNRGYNLVFRERGLLTRPLGQKASFLRRLKPDSKKTPEHHERSALF
jgi:hypothetical protein